MNILEVMDDPNLFGKQFEGFDTWRVLLAAFYGLDLDFDQYSIFNELTHREKAPDKPFKELWLAVGRRGGKSQIAALIGAYEAVFKDHRDKLAPGEVATVMLLAADRSQARTLLRYVQGIFEHPMFAKMVKNQTSTGIELTNRAAIEIHTASKKAVRGYTIAAAILDEIAFWPNDGLNPDDEVIAAIRPALTTLNGSLIALSSPYAKRGMLWNTYHKHFGKDASQDILVAQAPTRTMNPTIPQRVVDDAMNDDAARACAEYLAQFRTDIASLLTPELIDENTRPKQREIPPHTQKHNYFSFVDPAGGGQDEFTIAIGHLERDTVVADLVRGLKGSPASIVQEYSRVLDTYDIKRVTGDRYAGRWPRDEFLRWGVNYHLSDLDRNGLYLELLASLNSGRVEIPPDDTLKHQLVGLERRTSRSGRDLIDHPPGSHDDRANALAGLVTIARKPQGRVHKGPLPF